MSTRWVSCVINPKWEPGAGTQSMFSTISAFIWPPIIKPSSDWLEHSTKMLNLYYLEIHHNPAFFKMIEESRFWLLHLSRKKSCVHPIAEKMHCLGEISNCASEVENPKHFLA